MKASFPECPHHVMGESRLFSPTGAPNASASASKDILAVRALGKKSENSGTNDN
jgi:hypothetical protein